MKNVQFPRWIGMIITAFGIGLMVYGAIRGEGDVVLQKAINICLECIGIG